VSVAISRLDADHAVNVRIMTYTDTINNDGFELIVRTWWDTVIHSVGVSWIAYEP
jgi:hypothetical protein